MKMLRWLVPTAVFLLWFFNALLVTLAVVNVALRTPERLGPGAGIGAIMAATLILGGWVILRRWRKGHISGFLKVVGVIIGLLWAVPAGYGVFVNAGGLYLAAGPLLLGLLVLWISLKPSSPEVVQ